MNKFFKKKHYDFFEYTKNSLFKHYWKGLFGILTIPFILFYIVLFIYNLRSTEAAFKYSSTEILSRSVTALDTLFDVLYKNYESIISNSNVKTFLLNDFFLQDNGYNTYTSSSEIIDQLINTNISLNYLDSIHIYSKTNDYFLSSENSNFSHHFYDSECYTIYKNCNGISCVTARKLGKNNIMTLCYIVNKGYNNEGAVFFNINIEKLLPSLTGINSSSGTLLLTDNEGKFIMSSDDNILSDLPDIQKSRYGSYEISKNSDYVCMSTRLIYENYILVYSVTKMIYFTAFYPFITNTILYFLFIFLALAVLSIAGTFKLYNSISNAFAYIEMPSSDNNSYSEFVYLTKNMMSRVDCDDKSKDSLADKIQKLKKYQALALQTQINPHFLFNSLNLIASYALESGQGDSPLVVIIDKLSDILRSCLNTKNFIIKIKEELDTTQKYIEIENIKHANSIDFIFDIDDNIYEYYTLKMILQPIIENAITHGVKLLRNENGIITISAKTENSNIVFAVTNNGPTIPPQRLIEIQQSLICVDDIPENNHIGLRNVNQRIKLIFGNDYGCSITSADNVTTVKIIIPIITKSNDNFIAV